MGLFGSLGFGGSSSKPVDMTPDEFKNIRGTVAGGIDKQIQSGGGPQYQGPFAAGMTGQEQNILGNVGELVQPGSQAPFAGQQMLDSTIGGSFLNSNPYLDQMVGAAQQDVRDVAEEDRLANRAAFTRGGQFIQDSSPFARAEAIRQRGLYDTLGQISSNLRGQNYEAERQRQVESVIPRIQAMQLVESGELDRQIKALEASALPRLIEQLGIDGGRQEFQRRVEALYAALGLGVQSTAATIGNKSNSFNVDIGSGGGGGRKDDTVT